MSLLDQINDELTGAETCALGDDAPTELPTRDALRRVKRRAYFFQTSEKLEVNMALRKALVEEIGRLEVSDEPKQRELGEYLQCRYISGRRVLSDLQIIGLLKSYANLSDKDKLARILQSYRGRVDPARVRHLIKAR